MEGTSLATAPSQASRRKKGVELPRVPCRTQPHRQVKCPTMSAQQKLEAEMQRREAAERETAKLRASMEEMRRQFEAWKQKEKKREEYHAQEQRQLDEERSKLTEAAKQLEHDRRKAAEILREQQAVARAIAAHQAETRVLPQQPTICSPQVSLVPLSPEGLAAGQGCTSGSASGSASVNAGRQSAADDLTPSHIPMDEHEQGRLPVKPPPDFSQPQGANGAPGYKSVIALCYDRRPTA